MNIGDKIKIRVKHVDRNGIDVKEFTVYQMYPKFCVLDSGKYKTCAYYRDIHNGDVITI